MPQAQGRTEFPKASSSQSVKYVVIQSSTPTDMAPPPTQSVLITTLSKFLRKRESGWCFLRLRHWLPWVREFHDGTRAHLKPGRCRETHLMKRILIIA